MPMRTDAASRHGSPSRYRSGRVNPVALALALLAQAGLVAGLLRYGPPLPGAQAEPPLVVRTFAIEPPPPPAPQPATPPPPSPDFVAVHVPRPLVQPLAIQPTIATTVEPVPVPSEPAIAAAPAVAATVARPVARPVPAGDLSSTMIHAPAPRYPRESRRRREQGTVLLAVLLSVEGHVIDIRVARSSGHARLDGAARDAVGKWRWSPTLVDGVAAQVSGTVEIPFMLTG